MDNPFITRATCTIHSPSFNYLRMTLDAVNVAQMLDPADVEKLKLLYYYAQFSQIEQCDIPKFSQMIRDRLILIPVNTGDLGILPPTAFIFRKQESSSSGRSSAQGAQPEPVT